MTPKEQTNLPAVGEVLRDRYRLEAVLGEGGFGRVYSATELGTQRTVAVKVLKRGAVKLAKRFRREARAIAALRCDHTLTLFDYGEHCGCLFMVTEFVAGEDLSDRLHREGRLTEPELVHVLKQVLESLREAHDHGVLHRDIKPANIRLYEYADDPLCVKVLDFGLAKAIDGEEAALTNTGAVIGTPRYMSPEQLTGEDLGPPTDIYSLGVVALESLLGPSHALLSDLANRLTGLQLEESHGVAKPLREVVNRMLEKKREARYRSAEEVLRDLHALDRADTEPAVAAAQPAQPTNPERPPEVLRQRHDVPQAAATKRERPPPPTPTSPPSRRAVVAGAFGVAALLAGIGVGVLLLDKHDVQQPDVPAVVSPSSALIRAPLTVTPLDASTHDAQRPCVLPFEGAGYIEEDSHALDAGRWYTYIPPGLSTDERHPLVILLHQQGHTGEVFLDRGGFKPLADEHGLILVAPTAAEFNAWSPHRETSDRVVDMYEDLAGRLCIDESRVYGVGHGSGAGIVPWLACRGILTAFATHALGVGVKDSICDPTDIPYMLLYPTKSGYEPFEGGTTCSGAERISAAAIEQRWSDHFGCMPVEEPIFRHEESTCWEHDCDVATFQICHVDGGHGWTGTPGRARKYRVWNCDGPTPTFPMAERIWEFFSRVTPARGARWGASRDAGIDQ